MAKTKKIYVQRRMKGYAYADGQTHEMPEDHAKLFLDTEFGLEKEPKPQEPKETADLPEDIPYRQHLINAGFTRYDMLKNHKSLATIKHITEKRAEKLKKYFEAN